MEAHAFNYGGFVVAKWALAWFGHRSTSFGFGDCLDENI
jgi:hypothetical protein